MPEDVEVIDLRDRPDDGLLDRVYTELYLPSFPLPEEREDPSVWRPALWGEPEDDASTFHFLVAGSGLGGVAPKIAGLITFEYYAGSRCGLIGYVAVALGGRRAGLARELLARAVRMLHADAAAAGARLAAVFAEINDPTKVSAADDSIDPRERVAAMARMGARRVPIPYVQPELRPGQGRGRRLVLVAFPLDGTPVSTLETNVVRAFLAEYYEGFGVADPEADPDLAAMTAALDGDEVALGELA
jgi:hypothetical protein